MAQACYHGSVILDCLANRAAYSGLGEQIISALEFLASPQALALEPAAADGQSTRFDVRGDEVFALVQRYRTKEPSEAFWEAHRRHMDVQFVVEGEEAMGWMPLSATRIVTDHDPANDLSVLAPVDAAEANYARVGAGMFTVFFPHDAHMPGLAIDGRREPVKKIVMKIRV
jgi:biofilm protein TabA